MLHDLLIPTDHAGAYEWAAVFLAHATIGLFLVATVAAVIKAYVDDFIDGEGSLALVIVTLGYLGLWEAGVQSLGAGVADAMVDTLAVFLGGAMGLLAWARKGGGLAVAFVVTAGAVLAGVWRRRGK